MFAVCMMKTVPDERMDIPSGSLYAQVDRDREGPSL